YRAFRRRWYFISLYFLFLFLILRRPPRPTLFPYTRSSDLDGRVAHDPIRAGRRAHEGVFNSIRRNFVIGAHADAHRVDLRRVMRSEEHTSELQSPYDLVCRLLLEKKKKPSAILAHNQNLYT